MARDLLEVLLDMRERRRPYAVATVIETTGSSSAKTAAKAVIDEAGQLVAGWIGGGCAESMTRTQALECMKTGGTAVLDIDLDSEVLGAGMPCGGSMRVYIEPVLPVPALWITGHGRVAECLSYLGDLQGLEVVVIDRLLEADKYAAQGRPPLHGDRTALRGRLHRFGSEREARRTGARLSARGGILRRRPAAGEGTRRTGSGCADPGRNSPEHHERGRAGAARWAGRVDARQADPAPFGQPSRRGRSERVCLRAVIGTPLGRADRRSKQAWSGRSSACT
jgi:hypothetical protein